MKSEERYKKWLRGTEKSVADHSLLLDMTEREKDEAFRSELTFGTGGIRGKLGMGTSCMNRYTVGRITFGVADYFSAKPCSGIAIAYDSRHKSREFARLAAGILSSKGIEVIVFDDVLPTPVLSFAVRNLKLSGGIVITASHNPKEYNGYKVYNEKGCQITDNAAKEIAGEIEKHDYFEQFIPCENKVHNCGNEGIISGFIEAVMKFSIPVKAEFLPKVIYSPLNGTGGLAVKLLFRRMGMERYAVVREQEYPNGDFTTCPYPNPEDSAAYSKAMLLAEKSGAEMILLTDPDADRVGVAVREEKAGKYKILSGNETGVLLENFILAEKKRQGKLSSASYIVKTIVTTPLADRIAENYGVKAVNVLTGFKYIGETIDRLGGSGFVFGMEESCGYLVGDHVRDKDSISAILAILQMAAYYKKRGETLLGALNVLYEKFGYSVSELQSRTIEGEEGQKRIQALMRSVRDKIPESICGEQIQEVKDYLRQTEQPPSDVVEYRGENFAMIFRPSGTEPKIKVYITVSGSTPVEAKTRMEKFSAFAAEIIKQ